MRNSRGDHSRLRACVTYPLALALVAWMASIGGAVAQTSSAAAVTCPPFNAAKVANPLPPVPATNPTGALSGSFSVGVDGAAHYSLPLEAIPGPGGMTPALSISYSSRSGNGYLGVGFSLSGPTSIARCPKTIADDGLTQGVRLDATDKFCLSGLPLIAIKGAYGAHGTEYRTNPETFVRVQSFRTSAGSPDDGPDHFEVRSKDGLIETYGLGDTDRVGPRRVAWPINETRDRLGNRMKFIYNTLQSPTENPTLPGNSTIFRSLSEIQYGNFNVVVNGVTASDRRVLFTYEDRPDLLDSYAYGDLRIVRTRLAKIEMQRWVAAAGGTYTNARSYHLTYQSDGATGYSKLSSVQQCGLSSTTCLPATTFDWELGAAGFEAGKVQPLSIAPISTTQVLSLPVLVLDIDGDGKNDMAYADDAISGPAGVQWVWRILRSNGNGAAPFLEHDVFTVPQEGGPATSALEASVIDYDLDGLTDILPRDTAAHEHKTWRPLLSRKNVFSNNPTMVPINTAFVGPINQRDAFATFGDFDGDGYQDVLERWERLPFPNPSPGRWYLRQRTGAVSPAIQVPVPAPPATDIDAFTAPQLLSQLGEVPPDRVLVLDLNGDGKDEILLDDAVHDTLQIVNIPWLPSIQEEIESRLPTWILKDGVHRVFGDFNGDGLIDLVTNVERPQDIGLPSIFTKVFLWLNRGRGFTSPQPPVSNPINFDLQHAVVVDYNGDGKQDLLIPAVPTTQLVPPATPVYMYPLLSKGNLGFEVPHDFAFMFQVAVKKVSPDSEQYEIPSAYFASQGPRVLDADGDGQDDIIVVDRNTVNPTTPSHNQFLYYGHKRNGHLPDQLIGVHEGLAPSPVTLAIRYAPLTASWAYTRSGCNHQKHLNCAINPYYVVDEVRRNAGLPGDAQNTAVVSEYDYKNSITHKTSREWLGFAEQRVHTSPSDQSQLPAITRRFYSNTVAKRDPRLLEEWRYGSLSDGRIWLERRRQTWGKKDTPGPLGGTLLYDFVEVVETSSYEFPPGTTTLSALDTMPSAELDKPNGFAQPFQFLKTVRDQILGLDDFGNVTKRRNFYGPGSFQTIIDTTYDVDLDSWLLIRPRKVITTQTLSPGCTNPAECLETFTTEFPEYFRTASGIPTGLPLKVRSYHTDANPGPVLEMSYGYDTYGHVIRNTASGDVDGKGTIATRETCTTYDPDGVFPHAVSNALGHTAYTRVDPLLAVPTVTVDAKGRRADTQYDTLGRPVKVRTPSGVEHVTRYFTEPLAGTVLTGVEASDATGRKAQTLHDRLGRPVIERVAGFEGDLRVMTRQYDATGHVTRQDSMPVRAGSAPPPAITSTYDARGRRVTQTEPNTTDPTQTYVRSWQYDRTTVTYTDTRGNVSRQERDIAGHLSKTIEAVGKPEQVARTFQYTLFDRLKSSEVSGRPETASQYTYDYRGNVLSRTDPDRGRTTSQYNAFNEPIVTRDANGRESRPTYDVLGRTALLRMTEGQGNSLKLLSLTTYTYDREPISQQAQPGQLTRMQREDYVSVTAEGEEQRTQVDYDYDDVLGRLSSVTHTVPSDVASGAATTYTVGYTYDALDRLQTVRYPKLPTQAAPITLTYQYAAPPGNGQLRSISLTENGAVQSLWSLIKTDEANRPMVSTSGDGIITSQQYDWRGALAGQQFQTGTTDACPACSRGNTSYFYDGEGNLDRRVDTQQGATERFSYDAFDRVTKASIDGPEQVSQTWTYDGLGNLLTNTHRGTYHYDDPARPMRLTRVTGGAVGATRAYGYDAVGNQITRPNSKVVYNELNLPARLLNADGQSAVEFLYGPGGERVRKSSKTAGVVTTIGGLYELERRGTSVEHRLLFPGGAVLPYVESNGALTKQPMLFAHGDHLGSTNAVTADENAGSGVKAVVKEARSYDAFGLTRNPRWKSGSYTNIPAPLITQGYTGHDDDPELGLINMKGRIYDPQLGRFLTPDPIVSRPTATQSWNPYAYVSNNPLRYTDPTGFEECAGCDEFLRAAEAYQDGGPGGYVLNEQGQLEREFNDTHNRVHGKDDWRDRTVDKRLPVYSEKKPNPQACPVSTGSTAGVTREAPPSNCGGSVSRNDTSTGGNATTSPGMTDSSRMSEAEGEALEAELCRLGGCADPVTVYGHTAWTNMWCKGGGCIDTTQKSQQWAQNLGAIESFSLAYLGTVGVAVGAAAAVAELPLIGLEASAAAAKAQAVAQAAAARAATAQAQAAAAAVAARQVAGLSVKYDGMAFWARVAGDSKAVARVVQEPGALHVTDIFRGAQGPGAGSQILAAALKEAGGLSSGQHLVLKGIINAETLGVYETGGAAAESLLGRLGAKALGQLGLEASSFEWQMVRGKLDLVIKVK